MNHITLYKNTDWHHQLQSKLEDSGIECHFFLEHDFKLLSLAKSKILIHLADVNNRFQPVDFLQLQEKYNDSGIKLIHLWEDIWRTRPLQVLARIKSLLGLNVRIHGRKTKVYKIEKPVADQFIDENHLQGSVSSRHKLGLFEGEQLVAVATFSALRKMNHTENYKSAELIRFAVKAGYTITGGLSKLIKHFYLLQKSNDLMTYADRDWSGGEAYLTLGFALTGILEPQQFLLDENLNRKLKKDQEVQGNNPITFNTGSFKFILSF
ncbi:hypothetical protein EV200_104145 [Pedobacter psychrotolerans]|uniref:Uncharacterized protein n=1 Tax=Pedobacter psychrotolerans TaxID=1843235 RepID=A0A4R2HBV1_9SPHI|nr:hypothetical protein [Pedobacter psychrotolerans]TCO25109.1 hypothetical protein EV200_104145 [Pedobacter psychrotolerans]GGE48044.1 hypothetical protein GCM10011413_12660 [Pedobacter psychrotolerans]